MCWPEQASANDHVGNMLVGTRVTRRIQMTSGEGLGGGGNVPAPWQKATWLLERFLYVRCSELTYTAQEDACVKKKKTDITTFGTSGKTSQDSRGCHHGYSASWSFIRPESCLTATAMGTRRHQCAEATGMGTSTASQRVDVCQHTDSPAPCDDENMTFKLKKRWTL